MDSLQNVFFSRGRTERTPHKEARAEKTAIESCSVAPVVHPNSLPRFRQNAIFPCSSYYIGALPMLEPQQRRCREHLVYTLSRQLLPHVPLRRCRSASAHITIAVAHPQPSPATRLVSQPCTLKPISTTINTSPPRTSTSQKQHSNNDHEADMLVCGCSSDRMYALLTALRRVHSVCILPYRPATRSCALRESGHRRLVVRLIICHTESRGGAS